MQQHVKNVSLRSSHLCVVAVVKDA